MMHGTTNIKTHIHAAGGIRTRKPSKRAAAPPRRSPTPQTARPLGPVTAFLTDINFSLQSPKTGNSWTAQQAPSAESKVGTYLFTACSEFQPEKLTVFQPVKNFPAFYGTRKFIIEFTSSRHLSLTWASSISSTHPHPVSW